MLSQLPRTSPQSQYPYSLDGHDGHDLIDALAIKPMPRSVAAGAGALHRVGCRSRAAAPDHRRIENAQVSVCLFVDGN
jgi:hypothetical protein